MGDSIRRDKISKEKGIFVIVDSVNLLWIVSSAATHFLKNVYTLFVFHSHQANSFSFLAEIQKIIHNKNKLIQHNRNKRILLPPLSYELTRNSASFAR